MLNATPHLVIVGGGFTAASLSIQLLRRTPRALDITIIEPRERLGVGLAYSGDDPDHRLNAPTGSHAIDPLDPHHLTRWCASDPAVLADAEARMPNGLLFIRRRDFGRYLEHCLAQVPLDFPQGVSLRHLQDQAIAIRREGEGWSVRTGQGTELHADQVLLATGNPPPALRAPLDPALADHPRVIANPLRLPRLPPVDAQARVLVVGSALTAQDMISTLVRRGHRGPIVAVSRRALLPRPHAPELLGPVLPPALLQATETPLDRILRPLPDFLAGPEAPSALGWTRALRSRIALLQAQGLSWHAAFDDLRDAVWQAWPRLPAAQKQRFLARMRTWYDVHRFRSVPFNDAIVGRAQEAGLLQFRKARLRGLRAADDGPGLIANLADPGQLKGRDEPFDWLINCTGLDPAAGIASNPVLADLQARGELVRDASGIGFQVDAQCAVLDAQGRTQPGLFAFGPPTAGVFGDPLGALFISAQIHRTLPHLLQAIHRPASSAHPS